MLDTDKIYCGDTLEILREIDSDTINLVVTSPPYNLGIDYDEYRDSVSWDEYYAWCRKWLAELLRVIKPDGRVAINHYLTVSGEVRSAPLMRLNSIAEDIGFKHHGIAIWWETTISKNTAWGSWLSPSSPYISNPLEGIIFLYKESWKRFDSGVSNIPQREFVEGCSGIWKMAPEKKRLHPAPFPVELPGRCIRLLSYEGDLVLDPFCGSGTTCLAAKMENRHYIGIDISPKYCEMARKRCMQTRIADWMA